MTAIDYRAARSQLRLAEVLELIGYQPRSRQGDQWRGLCPLHGSRSATSRVFAAPLGKNLFHCFRCGAGGNALDLWVALTGQPLHAAVLDLCQRLNRPVPWLSRPTPAPARGLQRSFHSPEKTTTMPASQPSHADRAGEPDRLTEVTRDERDPGCCKQPNVGDIDPVMHPCATVPDLVALIGPRHGSAIFKCGAEPEDTAPRLPSR